LLSHSTASAYTRFHGHRLGFRHVVAVTSTIVMSSQPCNPPQSTVSHTCNQETLSLCSLVFEDACSVPGEVATPHLKGGSVQPHKPGAAVEVKRWNRTSRSALGARSSNPTRANAAAGIVGWTDTDTSTAPAQPGLPLPEGCDLQSSPSAWVSRDCPVRCTAYAAGLPLLQDVTKRWSTQQ
jgi:hypothetical protein